MAHEYQWLVARGRVAIRADGPSVQIELDPEGSLFCVLEVSDAIEIARIVSEEARTVWEESGQPRADAARVEGDVAHACRISCGSQQLKLIVHDTKPVIAIESAPGPVTRMDVNTAVAFVQVLEYMVATLNDRGQ